MRSTILLLIILFFYSTLADQLDQYYAIPKKNNVGVYENHVRKVFERAKFTVSLENRLTILEEKQNMYKVQDEQNRVGWIEKRLVVKKKRSKSFIFGDAYVRNYIDIPTLIPILDADDKMETKIKLERSFKEHLKQNTDRETLGRMVK